MPNIGKGLIVLGLILIGLGVLWHFGSRYFSFGKLPGDILVERENFRFYFPIVTCVILSVILSLLVFVFRLFK